MPRPDVSEERKQQILDAAAIVFSQQGFANTRMDDIVKQSGLSKGALYWYFKSKDEIIHALMHRFFAQDLDELDQLLNADLSARDTLLNYIQELLTAYRDIQPLMPLMYDYYSSATRDEEKREFFREYFQQYQALIMQILQCGIDDGEFKPFSLETFVFTLTAIVEGSLLLHTLNVDMFDLQSQVVDSVTLLLDSIQAT